MAEAKKSLFDNMTDDQIVSKAQALAKQYANVPPRRRPQAFYDFGNKAADIERTRRDARVQKQSSREAEFNTGLSTTWKVPTGSEQTRNRLAALIFQESGPRRSASPEYTMLGERIVASVLKNYMDRHGLTTAELIDGKGQRGGPRYLSSIVDVQRNPGSRPYDWANDKFNLAKFTQDDTTFGHMTNAVRLASALVNGTLRPLTSATHFKHLGPTEEFKNMARIDYDFGNTPVPTDKILKLYDDVGTKQAAKGGDARDVRTDNKGGKAKPKWTWETYRWHPKNGRIDPKNIKGTGRSFDEKDRAVLPTDRRQAFEAWMDELADPKGEWTTDDGRKVKVSSQLVPKDWRTNREHDRDYDYVRAFLLAEQDPGLKQGMIAPVFHAEDGKYWLHMNDVGKLPTHPTFSRDSYYAQDPKYAPLAGSWEGEEYIPGEAERAVHEDAKGGDTGPVEDESIPEPGGASVSSPAGGGPRIVINPSTFRNEKDALCVAFNEAFRLVMEEMGFNPVAEPTEAQRRFFSDTAYADDELQLRRTILARLCTFDTSVKDPTDEQIQEAQEFLENVLEAGFPQNEWEQSAVQRIHDVIARVPTQRARQTDTQTGPFQDPGTSPAGN